MKVSIRRASFGDMYAPMSKPFTSPAIWQPKLVASKRVMRATPDRPATRLSHATATSLPTGLITPSPVTTTRRRPGRAGATDMGWRRNGREGCGRNERGRDGREASGFLQVRVDVVNGLLHGADLLGLFVRDL